MRSSYLPLAVWFVSLAACHASAPAQPAAPGPPALAPTPPSVSAADEVPPPRGDGRLPALARPERYALALDVDPAMDRFRGKVSIDVSVLSATSHIVLHGRSLHVTEVTATTSAGTLPGTAVARTSHGGVTPEELVLSFPAALSPGHVRLGIAYDAPFDGELSGLYRVKEGEKWYAFTQFESTAARRAFPCFDEPGYKVPIELHVTAPNGTIAVANMPELSRAASGAGTRFDFAVTPPLPTYLLALAVGDFDVREGAKSPVPIRLVTVKGKSALGESALEAAAGLVKQLGDYFALPYPFPKLDLVAVPDFAAGAMENPGLVTFREEIILLDPAHPSPQSKRFEAVVIAHELAHIWFGDLVTMKWWDDVWLNEGFASWMEVKATDLWRPEYATRPGAAADDTRVMDTDGLSSSHPIRQRVSSTSEIEEMFDGISYAKASAVLRMIEQWIGPETMQKGVREYIRAHQWQNADATELLAALDQTSGRDVSGMAATFIDRPGVPSVEVKATCGGGKLSLGLTQSAWRPLGLASRSEPEAWRIPVCVETAGSANAKAALATSCTELEEAHGTLDLAAQVCPAWTLPNPGQAGYYRVLLGPAELHALAQNVSQLDVPSRIGLIANAWAGVRAGQLAPDALLDLLPAFDHETSGDVLGVLVRTLRSVDRALVDEATRPAFRAFVSARLERAKKRLGWEPTRGEAADLGQARTEVVDALGSLAHDPTTLREAEEITARWLKAPSSVDPDVAAVAIPLASIHAPSTRLDDLRAAAKGAETPLDRATAVSGMGVFSDPATLEKAWTSALESDVRQQDAMAIFSDASGLPERARLFFPWLEAHWDQVKARAPAGSQSTLVATIATACTQDEVAKESAFLAPRAKELEGAVRPLALYTERAVTCTALRARDGAAVSAYFARRKGH